MPGRHIFTILLILATITNTTVLSGGEHQLRRHRRDRAKSRYNPASSGTNPHRGRKRIRLDSSQAQSPQSVPQPQPQPVPETSDRYDPFQFPEPEVVRQPTSPVRSRVTLNRNRNVDFRPQTRTQSFQEEPQQQQQQPSRSRSRSRSRHQNINRQPEPPLSVTERSRYVNTNRFPSRGGAQREIQSQAAGQDRDYNPSLVRNLNKFYGAQTEKRKELFDRKKTSCDYDDYDSPSLASSQDTPSHIRVTHILPLATNINNFLLPAVTSVQLVAVRDLKSTNIEASPVIYAHLRTVAGQEVLYDALRAEETIQISVTTACYNGRATSYSQPDTVTLYSVETVTSSLPVQPGQTQDISQLLSKFLSLPAQPGPSLQVSSTEITSTILHSSTYVTKVTETESSEISITFRGKPIVTTLLDTSVKEITATEFSTETRVDTKLVTETLQGDGPVLNTELLQLSELAKADPSLENQLLLLQLSNLLPQQQSSIATPALPAPQATTSTYEVIHTSSYVTTLTEEDSQIIPLIFRGKKIETTIVETNTREITATEYSTEVVTETQVPALGPVQPEVLGNILPDLINIPELAQLLQQSPPSFQTDLDLQYEDIESLLLNPELLEALQNDPEIANFQNNENLHEERIIQTETPQIEIPVQFSVTTIFKSGKNPGEFTRLISTIYYDEKRRRREARIPPVEASKAPALELFDSSQHSEYHQPDLIQSGRNF